MISGFELVYSQETGRISLKGPVILIFYKVCLLNIIDSGKQIRSNLTGDRNGVIRYIAWLTKLLTCIISTADTERCEKIITRKESGSFLFEL